MNLQIILAALIAATSFGGAWQIQDWRYGAREAAHEQQKLADRRRAGRDGQPRPDGDAGAVRSAASFLGRNADGARAALVSLHDAADAAMRSAETSHAACIVTADAERVVLGQCSESYRSLAEVADGHASDVKTLTDACPR